MLLPVAVLIGAAVLAGVVAVVLVVRHERREIAEWQRISEHLARDARMRRAWELSNGK